MMINKIISFYIVTVCFLFSAQECRQGFHPFGIPKTVLSGVKKELNSFKNSSEAESLKPRLANISSFLKGHKESQTSEQKKELLRLINKLRLGVSEHSGDAQSWQCSTEFCDGHTIHEKFSSYKKAEDGKSILDKHYKDMADIDSSSVKVSDIKTLGNQNKVTRNVLATITVVIGAVAAIQHEMSIYVPGSLSLLAFYTAFYAITEYSKIKYEVSVCYNHNDQHLGFCENRLPKTENQSTAGLIQALDSLYSYVQRFETKQELKN